MKGRLVKKKKEWLVLYVGHPVEVLEGEQSLVNYISLHPDDLQDVKDYVELNNITHGFESNMEVEFDLVTVGNKDDLIGKSYAKLINTKSMTLQEAINILTIHQQWRKGADFPMIEPKELSEAIDIILDNHLHNQLAETSKMVLDENGRPLTYWGGVDFTNPNANNIKSGSTQFPKQYYQETFGQDITLQNNSESKDITELSDDSWEGCNGCTEQDEAMYKNGYTKGYNAAIAEQLKQK
jgi:hypothetical protein